MNIKRIWRIWVLEKVPFFKHIEAVIARDHIQTVLRKTSLGNTAKLEGEMQKAIIDLKYVLEVGTDEEVLEVRRFLENLAKDKKD